VLIEFNEKDQLKVVKKYLRNMGVFQKEMGEALKLQYFKSARMWPGMTVQRV
jgi:hypothetical protein